MQGGLVFEPALFVEQNLLFTLAEHGFGLPFWGLDAVQLFRKLTASHLGGRERLIHEVIIHCSALVDEKREFFQIDVAVKRH